LKVAKYASLAGMLFAAVVLHVRHGRYLGSQESLQRRLLEAVPENALLVCNKDVAELLSPAWGMRDYRLFARFNVPVPMAGEIERVDTAYAALVHRPGETVPIESGIYQSLLARYPLRDSAISLVGRDDGFRFEVVRLKPGRRRAPGAVDAPAGQDPPISPQR
jgi:hypothetical protein